MAKITIKDLKDAGFGAEQFPPAPDFDAPTTGYLARLIDRTALRIAGRVGSAAYAAVTDAASVAWARLARAELYAASAELWRRRVAFVDGNASHAADQSPERNRREYIAHADACDALSEDAILEFIEGADGPASGGMAGFSMGTVETGPYCPVTR